MKEVRIAKRYAKALFDFALEKDIPDEVNDDMILIDEVCEMNRDFLLLLVSPVVKYDKKIVIIKEIFEDHINDITLSYLQLITRKRREKYIPDISREYIRVYKEFRGIKTIRLITATPADEDIRQKVLTRIKKYVDARIELIEEVNEDLIGGFILIFDDKQYDASILKSIQLLKKDFEENIYIREF